MAEALLETLRNWLGPTLEVLAGPGHPPTRAITAIRAVLIAVANGLVLQVAVDPRGPALEEMAAQFGALLLAARIPA